MPAGINIQQMRPVEVARLVNSTALGFVMEQKRIYREFSRVGFKIAATDDGRCINLVKYIAYLVDLKNDPPEVKVGRTYEERKEAERARNAAQSAAGRDIGDLPEVFDPDRKEACREDFQKFCES